MGTQESVTLVAELRDDLSGPSTRMGKTIEQTTTGIERSARRQNKAVKDAANGTETALDKAERKAGALGRVFDRVGGNAGFSRLKRGVESALSGVRGSMGSAERDADKLATSYEKSTGRGRRAFSGLKSLAVGALGAISAAAIGGLANSTVNAFSELEDSTAAAGVVFGKNMEQIIAQSQGAAKTMGLTQQQVINAANTFGTYGKAAGLTGKDLADFATEQTQLAADMASFKGTSPEQAIEAIGSALRGEMEPIRTYGVLLDDAALKAEAMAQGLITTTKDALTPQQKTLAAQALILKQTADAQGDFARTSDSTANIQKTLSASSSDLAAKFGKVLAPAFTAGRKTALGAVSTISGLLDRVMAFQSLLGTDATTPDLVKALGLSPESGLGYLVNEGIGSINAFKAAWKANDGEITSSGLPGYMEGLAYKARGAFDALVQGGQDVWAVVGPAFRELGPPVLDLLIALSPLGLVLKALGPVLPDLATSAAELAAVVAGVLTKAVEFLVPPVTSLVGWLADFFTNLTSTQTGVDGLMGVLAVGAGIFVAYKLGVMGATVWTKAHDIATRSAAIGQRLLNVAMKANPIGLIVTAIAGLVAGLVWFFTQTETGQDIVTAAWAGIQAAVGVVVDWFQMHVLPVLQGAVNAIGAVFSWLWTNVLGPVFGFIGAAFNAFWMLASGVFNLVVAFVQKILAPAFMWFWNSVISPVFTMIGTLIGLWWNTRVMPIFNAVTWFVQDVLGPAFTWLYENVIKPVWDGISAVIAQVWENDIKPIFDVMAWFITTVIPDAFDTGVKAVGAIWEGVKAIAAAPVNFVIDTVINDGIIKTFNKVAEFLGVDPLPYVYNPLKAAGHTGVATSGGPNRAFASGGYTGDGGVHEAAGVVHGREYVFDADTTRRGGGAKGMAALAQAIKASPTGAMPTLNTGVPGIIASTGRNHAYVEDNSPGWFVPQAAAIISQMSALKLSMGRSGMPRIQTSTSAAMPANVLGFASLNNVAFNSAHAGMNSGMKLAVAIHELLHVLGQAHTNAPSIMQPVLGAHMMPTAYDVGQMQRLYGAGDGASFAPTGDGGGDGGGWNPLAGIMDGLISLVRDKFSDTFIADLAVGVGQKIFDTIGSKFDIFDTGGILHSGKGAVNLSGKPERVLSPEQTESFDDLVSTYRDGITPGARITVGKIEIVVQMAPDGDVDWDDFKEKVRAVFEELERRAY